MNVKDKMQIRRLQLNREALLSLAGDKLSQVRGGVRPDSVPSNCRTCPDWCE